MKIAGTTVLALLAGFGIGAVAVESLHAQAKPPAYILAENELTDEQGYMKDFAPVAGKIIQDHGGVFLARGVNNAKGLSGQPPKPRVVIVRFENMDKLMTWWNSKEWQDAH